MKKYVDENGKKFLEFKNRGGDMISGIDYSKIGLDFEKFFKGELSEDREKEIFEVIKSFCSYAFFENYLRNHYGLIDMKKINKLIGDSKMFDAYNDYKVIFWDQSAENIFYKYIDKREDNVYVLTFDNIYIYCKLLDMGKEMGKNRCECPIVISINKIIVPMNENN